MASESRTDLPDAERERAVALLGRHVGTGRLDLREFEGRLDAVYAARTRDDLAGVLTDVPAAQPPRPRAGAAWAPWALTGAICLVVWVATSLAQGRPLDFWPVWVIGPWGGALLVRTLSGAVTRPRG